MQRVHTYTPIRVEPGELPSVVGLKLRSALDVVEHERVGNLVAWRTWPEVWHLDETGDMTCYSKGSSLDSIRRWAEDPYSLLSPLWNLPKPGQCGDRWLIIESRTLGIEEERVSEQDAKAFLELRAVLAEEGIELVDAVTFDHADHWWSMHELTSGTMDWTVRSPDEVTRQRA